MSWTQRRGPSRPSATTNPPVQMYNPNQHSNTEWQAPAAQAWPHAQQQQQTARQDASQGQPYWQQSPQAYPPNQTPNANSAVQFQQYQQQDQAAYLQNCGAVYTQQPYGNVQYSQQYDQNNIYTGQQAAQQPSTEADTWGSWEWGDDDNSNAPPPVSQQPQPPSNQAIGESFSNEESWNWSLMDSQQQNVDESNTRQEQNVNNLFPTIGDLKTKSDSVNRKKLETPQWSTESQPSLESSDDVLHTSESDKSHMVSRSSTISHSPISGQESSPSTQGLVHQTEMLATNHHVENKEIIKQEISENRPQRVNPTPPLPKAMHTPPLLHPPQGGSDDYRNPYKRTTALSHKSAKFKPGLANTVESKQPPPPMSFPQSVNLETLPDNSEHPDHPLMQNTVKASATGHQQWPQTENNEAPINDRNQYLETGQLSEVNLPEGNEVADLGNDTLPPPGLQRMVPGQLEQNEVGSGRPDQPLPGFSRMVLGQNENRPAVANQNPPQFDLSGPPEGLHRMVPGESSSPETSLRQQNTEENDSELELNQLSQNHGIQPPRSATIGADTPPIQNQPPLIQSPPPSNLPSNRSETIGSDLAVSMGVDPLEPTQGPGVLSSDAKNNKNSKSKDKIEQQENRREAVEGQTNELSVSSLTNAVRNLTVGENLTDGHTSNNSLPEQSPRRHSRQESSDSESDRKNSRNHRDKRSAEKSRPRDKERDRYKDRDGERDRYRDRNSDRYSPDPYRDKREGRSGRRYRDKRYEEDTDYYSDKDRRRDERDRDYERKYSSLRKEKDKRRKDRDPRDYRDSRRGDYYYSRYGDDYGAENRPSRPSSRSDSMHESYRDRRHEPDSRDRRPRDRDRDRERERERYRNRDHRDVYNPYQSFAYDPYNPYYQQYQYYENLRRTNPQAYAEWYRKYYQQTTGSTASYTGEDRASVHSGRSSANDELAKDRYTRQSFYSQSNYYGQSHSISGHYGLDSSSLGYNKTLDQTDNSLIYEEQPSAAQRLTPTKFATAHVKASVSSGKLIRIHPNYPMDGQNAVVDVCDLQTFLENDPDYVELSCFPGPLIKGVTHKKQIIEYCDSKIKGAAYNRDIVDVESYVLMWELLILLIRQNGMVVGTDIAELLLENQSSEPAPRPPSVLSTTSSNVGDRNEASEASNQPVSEHGSTQSILKEEEVTRKFREYLLYGSCQEALEWAMKHGLWGHALFLASKLDKRTYANIMMRFANGLTMNDPLQTLYQLLSGKMPAVVTCVSDEKWGDWRPHLAMILSNSTQRPELNCKAITQLGDTLLNRGSLYAAQFCYLMAEVGFGTHAGPSTRLVLLGSDHRKPFPQFATNEALHMTEIYEFACSLNDQGFHIAEFQLYKYLLATRLADFGLLERALQYLELLAGRIISNPAEVSPSLVDSVCELSDRLKFYDPVGDAEDESEFGAALETSRPDNSWLKDLRAIQFDYKSGKISQDLYANPQDLQTTVTTENTLYQSSFNHSQDIWQQEQQQYDQQQQLQFEQQYQESPVWSSEQQSPNQGYSQVQDSQQQPNSLNQYQDQQNYWPGQPTWTEQANQYGQETSSNNIDQLHNQHDPATSYYDNSNNHTEKVEKEPAEVSTARNFDAFALPPTSVSLRKRSALKRDSHSPNNTSRSLTISSTLLHGEVLEMQPLKLEKNRLSTPLYNDSTGFFERMSSKDSSDSESEVLFRRKKNAKSVSEEKLLLLKNDAVKIAAHENYSTFDVKYPDRKGKLMKFKSLDIPEFKSTTVKYIDHKSKVSISAEDFNITSKTADALPNAVDVWSRKHSKGVFNNIKNSFFHRSEKVSEKVLYRPLVFGGTYPIDLPIGPRVRNNSENSKLNKKSITCSTPKLREYGPARTYDIDQPI